MANEFFTDAFTSEMQKLIFEVVNDPSTYLGSQYLPSISIPASKIRTEVVEASGGLTQEHVVGTDPKYVRKVGSRVQEFQPPKFKEAMMFDEDDILYLRQLGQNDPSKRGIEQHIQINIDKLNRRLEARIEKLRWDAIFNGGFTYQGNTISYGIPSTNRVVPVGAVWSSDGLNANNSADPLRDIRYWTQGGTSGFRKYGGKFQKMIMNGNTARWILDNANVQSLVKTYFSAENFGQYQVNKVIQLLIPGAPEVVIYNSWYQEESVNGDGKVVVGDAQFFIPDGYIFFTVGLPNNDKIGEFVQGAHIAEGTIQAPGYGKFLVVEDCTAPGTRGGPKNPFIDVVAGVYGGVKLDRPFDVLTAKVIT